MSAEKSRKVSGETGNIQRHWWQTDKVDAIGWGIVFIWAALILLADITDFSANLSWWNGWGVFLVGAGAITLITTIVRAGLPEYRDKWLGGLIWGCILLAIGLGTWGNVEWIWVIALFAIGYVILHSAIAHKH
jgi:hypothetical protein